MPLLHHPNVAVRQLLQRVVAHVHVRIDNRFSVATAMLGKQSYSCQRIHSDILHRCSPFRWLDVTSHALSAK
jgi:hypothetical protein